MILFRAPSPLCNRIEKESHDFFEIASAAGFGPVDSGCLGEAGRSGSGTLTSR